MLILLTVSLYITQNSAGSAQGDVPCSREPDCDIRYTFDDDSVRDCCGQEGVLSHIPEGEEVCQLCYGMLNIICKKCRFVIFCAL